ncbi:hypothetical protein C8F04DRAFT_1181738, partial [Mycena alexandri]
MSAGSFDLWFELRIATYCAIPRGFRLLPARPKDPDFVVTTKRIPVLPLEIWRQIVAEFLPHPSNFPVYYAEARALIACEFLPAPKLRTLTVHYTLMEGYSSFESDDPIYFEPVDRRDWFGGALSNVTSLETCGIRMPGSVHSLASALVSLNISQGYSESLFEWEFFVQLFSAAVHLRHLKLAAFAGVVVPRATPDRAKLESTSLRVLDLTLDADAFAVSFIRLLAAPNLLDLTLRTVRTNAVESLEPCLPNFASLTRFCLHGSLGYDDDFYPLFDSMPKLSVLDVQHADEHAFIAYCGWSYLRELVQGLAARHPLRSLSVGMVDVGDL